MAWRQRTVLAAMLLLGACSGDGVAPAGGDASDAAASDGTDGGGPQAIDSGASDGAALDAGPTRAPLVHGDYAGALRDGNGDVDVAGTIARLADAHVDTYAYLVYQKPQQDWDALPAFLTAAAAKGIRVWVYLVPPTEAPGGSAPCTGDYPPYQLDYVAWAQQIATLSLAHPNLTAYAIDDFGYNTPINPSATCTTFSRAYVAKMAAAAHAVAPNLHFWPVLYYPDLVGERQVVSALRDSIGGVIFPFRDGDNVDTYVTASAAPEIELLGARLSCKRDLAAAATRGRSGCFEIAFPWNTASTAGAQASVRQTVSVGAGPRSLHFSWQHDFPGKTVGYVFAQVLVDGVVAWEADIGAVAADAWHTEDVALDALLSGKTSAALELRVIHKNAVSNFGHTIVFDEVEGSGVALTNGDFESGAAGWTTTSSSASFVATDVKTTSLVTMVYAATLSSDKAHPPTASYVNTVLGTGLDAARRGYADGVMTYVLDKRLPDTDIFAAVKALY